MIASEKQARGLSLIDLLLKHPFYPGVYAHGQERFEGYRHATAILAGIPFFDLPSSRRYLRRIFRPFVL